MDLTDWGISHTTLEDVFLKLAKDGHNAHVELFKIKMMLAKEAYEPGKDMKYVGSDGLEYTIPADKMPDQAKWDSLWNNVQADAVDWTAQVPKKMMDVAVQKKLFGARLIILRKLKPDALLGVGLGGTEAEPVVEALNPEGIASGRVFIGDTILGTCLHCQTSANRVRLSSHAASLTANAPLSHRRLVLQLSTACSQTATKTPRLASRQPSVTLRCTCGRRPP